MATVSGTPIMERNMEHSRGNCYWGTEYGTEWMEHPLWNGTWNTAGGTLIVEWNTEHGGWNSHCEMEHGTRRMELSLWKGT